MRRILSAALAIAMVLSLFCVPAMAADGDKTGVVGDSWVFLGGSDFTTDYAYSNNTEQNFQGVIISSGAGHHNGYCYMNKNHTVKIPVAGKCNVELSTYKDPAGTIGVDGDTETLKGTLTTYHYGAETAGYVTVATTAVTYLEKVEIKDYTAPAAALELSDEAVRVKVGAQDVTVTATVKNGTATAWEATSADVAVATANGDNGVITITPVAEGTTTVTVKATVDGVGDPLTADIAVTVEPAGEVVYTSWDFTASTWTAAEKVAIQSTSVTLRGLKIDATAAGAKFSGNQLGTSWVQFNKDTIIKVPVNVPEGKKALVSVKAYAQNTISVDGVPNQKANVAEPFVCAGTDGWVTIKGLGGQGYLASIAVEYGEGELTPVLTVDKTYLGLTMGGTESGEITATRINTTAAVKAESKDTSVATAAVNGDKVTITAVGAGSTTVDILVEGATNDLAKKTVTVDVEAAGTVNYIVESTYDFTKYTADTIASIKGLDTHGAVPQDATVSHGLEGSGTLTLTVNIPEGKKADLVFVTCRFGIGTDLLLESTSGASKKEKTSVDSGDGLQFTVSGVEGETTLTFKVPEGKYTDENGEEKAYNQGIWIHTMSVLFGAQKEDDRKIDVWDLTGQEVTGDKYQNNITPAIWKSSGEAVSGLLSKSTETVFGDFTLIHNTNDRLYSNVENAADFGAEAGSSYGKWTYDDGYVPNGGVYCNGTGSATARYMQVKNVFPGDKLVAYMGSAQNGDVTFTFEGLGSAAGQAKQENTVAVSTYEKIEFVAEQTGTYKIWASGGGKPMYQRLMRYPGVPVSGTITLPADYNGSANYGIKFVNKTTKATTLTEVKDNKFEVTLAPGYEYNAIMTGAAGWGFTVDTKTVTTAEDGGVGASAGMTHNMAVEPKSTYTFSGSFVGFADGYDISKLAVDLIPEEGAGSDDAALEITGKTFTATLDPEVEYTLVLSGVNDYVIKTPLTISSDKDDVTQNITVEAKALYAASGKFVTYDVDDQFAPLYVNSTYEPLTATVTALSFKNVDDGYTYPAAVANGGYTANLRAGAYEAVATVDGYTTKGHVVVDGKGAVSKDLMFAPKATPAAVDYAADVYVDGKGGTDLHFKTVTGAMAYIKRMTRTDAQRVTVHIAPGTYREQISIDSKNVTFVNDTPSKEVKLTWYYGIGYKYYSATGKSGTDSWYDVELAFDKYAKPSLDVARWGCTVRVQAPGFQAQDITFENSFNYYLTEEEIVDGVELVPSSTAFVREYGVDVTSKAATERAAAIWVDTNSGRGDMTEFKNCKFLSSQDTFGTGSRMYLKDCYIEGMTDYICGPGDCVFDTCTLNWKGYSDKEQVAYLTAPQTGASEKGYLFRNCYISGDTKLKLMPNHLGRTWGAANTKCIFLNTTLQSDKMIDNTTWIEMQGFNPANSSTLLEWGTMLPDGTKVDLSKRTLQNTVAKAEPTAKPEDYFGGWVPEYYVKEVDGVALAAAPTVSDNGDINVPKPGHTLTVSYTLTPEANNANDASTIQWYRVKDGVETPVKTSSATAGKTYQIQAADVGAKIKVTVTPKTLGGQTGAAMSYTVVETVQEGWDDPSGAVDPVLGAGVNVYLAGDSTVQDYSVNGMWNSGALQLHGSWGEFIQPFFNDKVTIVNYARGGRTTRQFIEDDKSLEKIDATMKEGDFLLIQFGHNDSYSADKRYVPLGIAKNDPQKSYAEGGVYPDTTADGATTYTGYLKQYIAVTEKHHATAILMTPVARMYYTSDGKIRPHHDAAVDGTNDNEYCKAVKWVYDWAVAQGYNVVFMDSYQLTADLFEKAYADCTESNKQTYGKQLMGAKDGVEGAEGTHNSKLGGLIEAAVIARAIQTGDLTISKAVKAPTQVQGKTTNGETAFTITGTGAFSAYDNLSGYADHATYWEGEGAKMFSAIAAKAAELGGTGTPDDPDDPDPDKTALNAAITAAEKKVAGIYTVSDDTVAADVNRGTKFVTESDKAALVAAIAAAKAVANNQSATEAQVTKAVADLAAATTAFNKAIKTGTMGGSTSGATSGRPSDSATSSTTVTNPDGSVATATTNANGDKTITVKGEDGEVLAEVSLPGTIPAPKTKFVDVPEGHWAETAINDMAGLGMVKGVSDNTYDMVSPMTRGAIATIFYRLSNGKEGKSVTFADVDQNAWYTDAVGWAAAAGVVNGYNETTFAPEETITRQQLAVMIARYARLLGLDTTAEETALATFSDGFATDSWAVDGMAWCVSQGIVKGKGGNVLDPTAAVTRAEAAVMMDRMIGLVK